MKSRPESLFACALLTLAALVAAAPAQAADAPFGVHVIVTASDEQTAQRVTADLNRGLASLANVDVVDSDPDFDLAVMVIAPKTAGGNVMSFTMVTIVLERFDNAALLASVDPQFQEQAKAATSALYRFPKTSLEIGPDLEELAKHAIAAFKAETLKTARKPRKREAEMPDTHQ